MEASSCETLEGVFYVYCAVVDGVVRYIGRGSGERLNHVNSGVSSSYELNKAHFSGSKVQPVILYENLSMEEACRLEAIEISKRVNLYNRVSYPEQGIQYRKHAVVKYLKDNFEENCLVFRSELIKQGLDKNVVDEMKKEGLLLGVSYGVYLHREELQDVEVNSQTLRNTLTREYSSSFRLEEKRKRIYTPFPVNTRIACCFPEYNFVNTKKLWKEEVSWSHLNKNLVQLAEHIWENKSIENCPVIVSDNLIPDLPEVLSQISIQWVKRLLVICVRNSFPSAAKTLSLVFSEDFEHKRVLNKGGNYDKEYKITL